ncbi:hypothetical protein HOC90_04170 [Candidatus Falkowbacteria bacterium]|jgi:type II secretory pathway pseudopilin PulG|nr:hypothetical protein [Elusimicrobiaceae bacterium]MBT4433512.1 hypothetical protein [Candidatus Falkowbacteria bacterium]
MQIHKIKKKLKAISYKLEANKAFTLIEILTIITIIVLLSGGIFYNFKVSKKSVLEAVVKEVVFNIKKVEQMSKGTSQEGVNEAIDCPSEVCAFGVAFNDVTGKDYIVFVDKNYDRIYQVGDKILETITLPNSIEYVTSDFINVSYESPYGTTHVYDSALVDCDVLSGAVCSIEIRSTDDNAISFDIKINNSGLTYVE